jgi:hypothetical protein
MEKEHYQQKNLKKIKINKNKNSSGKVFRKALIKRSIKSKTVSISTE